MAGQYVGLITTVTHFRQVIAGKLDDRPETAFYTLSGLEQVCFKSCLVPFWSFELPWHKVSCEALLLETLGKPHFKSETLALFGHDP